MVGLKRDTSGDEDGGSGVESLGDRENTGQALRPASRTRVTSLPVLIRPGTISVVGRRVGRPVTVRVADGGIGRDAWSDGDEDSSRALKDAGWVV